MNAVHNAAARPILIEAPDIVAGLFHAGEVFLNHLVAGRALDAQILRAVMTDAFNGSDADGAWTWKDAYEAVEVAFVLFLQRYGGAMAQKANNAGAHIAMLEKLSALGPRQSRRSEASQALQQYSTPLMLGRIAVAAAQIKKGDIVLEPSAGTGLLAAHAEGSGARLVLNELCDIRSGLLRRLYPDTDIFQFDAAQIDDRLPVNIAPSVVLMNPPFSASDGVAGSRPATTADHIRAAIARLRPGGRLVAITAETFSPYKDRWRSFFENIQDTARASFSIGVSRKVFEGQGVSVATRLTVIDKVPADDRTAFPPCHGKDHGLVDLLWNIEAGVISRARLSEPVSPVIVTPSASTADEPAPSSRRAEASAVPAIAPLKYEARTDAPTAEPAQDNIYQPYDVQTISIAGAKAHPDELVQSAAMASVRPPVPTYQPLLPKRLVDDGVLSDAQLEAVIYAGEAHEQFLDGDYVVCDGAIDVRKAAPTDDNALRFRKGWLLGDGTGVGKGRQVSGILLDNWLRGRRRGVWVSLSADLLDDARRDWSAVGGDPAEIKPISKFKYGSDIKLSEGILFSTYAALRTGDSEGKCSRVQQIVDWLGPDFGGVIILDEAHAAANAAGDKSARGDKKPSQQGIAVLRLQNLLPNARVVYASATGATTVANLAYASRLGLWGTDDMPFATRGEFVSAMEDGGVAAMEVISRDLKALGLYAARALSFHGVEYEVLVHEVTPAQKDIYDAYAEAFEIIHNNLEKALEASRIADPKETYNKAAKSAARSAFESAKQRFFNALLTAMKCPTLLKAIESDLDADCASVIQLISTGEALVNRRLENIPTSEWSDLTIDVTPRDYVLDYLETSFPTQLFKIVSDPDGNLISVPEKDAAGNPVQCREALRLKAEMIEKLALLPPTPCALDQLIHHFGTERVAEVTGRRRRIVRRERGGRTRLAVETRGRAANRDQVDAFQNGEKLILPFSQAGGTGRSFHADRDSANQRRRVHTLLEAGWRADVAIQGLGRSHRSNQAQPPRIRSLTTNVRGEARFVSTISRRLDTLGAITRGQRETGGQGLFRPEDNLESSYARSGLRKFYHALARGELACCSLERFIACTGLRLLDRDGSLLEVLPPIHTFLNRVLALKIDMQNAVFDDFLNIVSAEVEAARAAGTLDLGIETLRGDKFEIIGEQTIYTHPRTRAETKAIEIRRTDKTRISSLADVLSIRDNAGGRLMINTQSNRAAVVTEAFGFVRDDGSIEERSWLNRPEFRETISNADLANGRWREADEASFAVSWAAEIASVPKTKTMTFYLVTGLLLPIWKDLPEEYIAVRRVSTDCGRSLLGRLLAPEQLAETLGKLQPGAPVNISPQDLAGAIMTRGATAELTGGISLKRVRVMGKERIEAVDFGTHHVEQLKRFGCISEIANGRLALYAPAVALTAITDAFPVIRCIGR